MQDKCQKTSPRHIIFKLQNIKDKEKNQKIKKEATGEQKNTLPIVEQR